MPLLKTDEAYLQERGLPYEVHEEAGMTCIVFPGWVLPEGFGVSSSDLLIRLSPGYPDVPPDMWWFDPPVKRADGVEIPATQVVEQHLSRSWQRWSRHFQQGQWKSGVDGIESYLALIRRDIDAYVPTAAQ
jgi:hypothetical protein